MPLLPLSGLIQVAAVPGRLAAVQAADQAIETVLQKAMEQSFSVEERTRVRRMAALRKVILLRVLISVLRFQGSGKRGCLRNMYGGIEYALVFRG